MSDNPKDSLKQQVVNSIHGNIHRDDFARYINHCINKWKELEVELQVVDAIMSSVCKNWEISREQLIADKKYSEPRAMMYYMIKKEIKLSYGEIGDFFGIQKSYIHKCVDDMTFMIEKHSQKNMVSKFHSIQQDLLSKTFSVAPKTA